MPRDARTLSWFGLFLVAGGLIQWRLGSENFLLYALLLAGCGAIGAVGARSLLVAPAGLAIGQVVAVVAWAPRWNAIEILVMVASVSIAALAGLAAHVMFRKSAPDA
jgi:hypothetical protein